MRKNRTVKIIFNSALLAVMAVLGVTAYQVSSKKEKIQEVLPLESTTENESNANGETVFESEQSLAEAGTNLVEAELPDYMARREKLRVLGRRFM
mgnify:CR=1 FL=1